MSDLFWLTEAQMERLKPFLPLSHGVPRVARLKDWRRIATRYDRCADIFMSACAIAAVVMFWL